MAHVTGSDLYDLQFDALSTDTSTNPQLTYSKIAALNKSLLTTNKKVISAINEVKADATKTNTSFVSFTAFYNNILGDASADPTLAQNLQKIDVNVLAAIFKMYINIVGDADNPLQIPTDLGTSIIAAISKLDTRLTYLENNPVEDPVIDGGTF